MIKNDIEAKQVINDRIIKTNASSIENDLLTITKELLDKYSFVDNQTYPRPSHPDPKKRKDTYFTSIAIILSLRTTVENETKAVNNFCNKYSNINEVSNTNRNELISIIKCAGMPNKKAETILEISNYIIKNYNGNINTINNGNIEEIREKLFKIPGLGEKSVDCMLELAFDLPSIVIDTNVFRVISRIYFDKNMSFTNKKDIIEIKNFIESNIIKDYRIYQIFHTIILLHGKHICSSKPKCTNCTFHYRCKYYLSNLKLEQLELF